MREKGERIRLLSEGLKSKTVRTDDLRNRVATFLATDDVNREDG